jgi:hypothetical protein
MPTWSTKISDYAAARCLELTTVFQDHLLEEPLPATSPGTVRRRQLALLTTAQAACRECPLIIDCLYRAVVEYDVAGYVAGTTPPQRAQIRRQLDITVKPEDFDSLAGVARHHRQVNHTEVVRLRNANPNESLETLAQRLGCSLSTSSVTCAVSAASRWPVPLRRGPALRRWSQSRPLSPAHRSPVAVVKLPDSARRPVLVEPGRVPITRRIFACGSMQTAKS